MRTRSYLRVFEIFSMNFYLGRSLWSRFHFSFIKNSNCRSIISILYHPIFAHMCCTSYSIADTGFSFLHFFQQNYALRVLISKHCYHSHSYLRIDGRSYFQFFRGENCFNLIFQSCFCIVLFLQPRNNVRRYFMANLSIILSYFMSSFELPTKSASFTNQLYTLNCSSSASYINRTLIILFRLFNRLNFLSSVDRESVLQSTVNI